ncbi:MAG: hypothetical protein KY442_13000 [Proteobacteria bacterium]|nr:hypothetical protein [Pseudomonadota bacterium]
MRADDLDRGDVAHQLGRVEIDVLHREVLEARLVRAVAGPGTLRRNAAGVLGRGLLGRGLLGPVGGDLGRLAATGAGGCARGGRLLGGIAAGLATRLGAAVGIAFDATSATPAPALARRALGLVGRRGVGRGRLGLRTRLGFGRCRRGFGRSPR